MEKARSSGALDFRCDTSSPSLNSKEIGQPSALIAFDYGNEDMKPKFGC
jgi:hypothetical protein